VTRQDAPGPDPRHPPEPTGWGVGSSGGLEDLPEPEPDDASRRLLARDHRFERGVFVKGVLVLLLIAVLIWVRQMFLV
jgi:hypothetical protein